MLLMLLKIVGTLLIKAKPSYSDLTHRQINCTMVSCIKRSQMVNLIFGKPLPCPLKIQAKILPQIIHLWLLLKLLRHLYGKMQN